MTVAPPDGSRDRRIEDPSNLWLIHPLGRTLLPVALARGVSANTVSVAGLAIGAGAAFAYSRLDSPALALVGLLLAIGWLVMDGLDGMVARATATASPLGRIMDGLCDHGVFALIYLALAFAVDTPVGWLLTILAATAHAVQSSLYEGERARFHRRIKGIAATAPVSTGGPLVRLYDRVAGLPDRLAAAFERRLATAADPIALGRTYGAAAVAPMKLLSLQTANARVAILTLACLAGEPQLFWWAEIVPLSLLLIAGLAWHRRVEASVHDSAPADRPARIFVKEHP